MSEENRFADVPMASFPYGHQLFAQYKDYNNAKQLQ